MGTKILLLTILLAGFGQAQHGIHDSWLQTPSEIPKHNPQNNSLGAVANNMVVTSTGQVVVFYSELNGSQTQYFFVGSNDDGLTWSSPEPTLFTPSIQTNGNSSLSVDIDENDEIHAVWTSSVKKAVFYSHTSVTDFNWSDTVRIGNTNKSKFGFCQVSCDRKSRVHVYWHEGNTGTNETAEVYYVKSDNSGVNWYNQHIISSDDGRNSAFPSGDFYGVLGDTLAIAWRDSIGPGMNVEDWDVVMSISTDGGSNWSTPMTVIGGSGMQSDPAIVVDKKGRIHCSFHEYPEIGGVLAAKVYYSFSDDLGQNWNNNAFQVVSEPSIQSHLVKAAYDYATDRVWYFYKDQRDYVSPFDKRADIVAFSIDQFGTKSLNEFITDADSNEVGFHNFKVGMDGIPRAHFFYMKYGTDSTTLYYTQRLSQIGITQHLIEPINYTNPVLDYFIVNSAHYLSTRVYDLKGKCLGEFTETKMDFTQFDAGILFVEIQCKNEIKYLKIIKI